MILLQLLHDCLPQWLMVTGRRAENSPWYKMAWMYGMTLNWVGLLGCCLVFSLGGRGSRASLGESLFQLGLMRSFELWIPDPERRPFDIQAYNVPLVWAMTYAWNPHQDGGERNKLRQRRLLLLFHHSGIWTCVQYTLIWKKKSEKVTFSPLVCIYGDVFSDKRWRWGRDFSLLYMHSFLRFTSASCPWLWKIVLTRFPVVQMQEKTNTLMPGSVL